MTISSLCCFSSALTVYNTLSPNEVTKAVFFFWGNSLNILKRIRKTNKYKLMASSLTILYCIQVFFDFCCRNVNSYWLIDDFTMVFEEFEFTFLVITHNKYILFMFLNFFDFFFSIFFPFLLCYCI